MPIRGPADFARSAFGASAPARLQSRASAGGVAIEELKALSNIDLVSAPEHAASIGTPLPSVSDDERRRLGPMPFTAPRGDAAARAVGRLLAGHRRTQSEPIAGDADDILKDARMLLVVEQIQRFRTIIRSRAIKPA